MARDLLRDRICSPSLLVIPRHWQFAPIIGALLILSACEPEQLAWIDHANAEKMAARDIAEGKFRFFSVCGVACGVPGAGNMNAKLCYSKAVVQVIEGTSDGYESDEELRLNIKANDFATRYNLQMVSHLKSANLSLCKPSTDWDQGFHAMHRYVDALNNDPRQGGLVAFNVEKTEFNITLPLETPFEAASPVLCRLIKSHGLDEVAVVKLRHRDKPDAGATALDCRAKIR
jgi:hypothetical protein